MKRNPEVRRLSPGITARNKQSLSKVKSLKGYKPAKDEFSLEELEAADKEVDEAREAEAQANQAAKAARNRAVAAEWALHNKILGAKKQVIAIYGEDSDEIQAVGLKKKSEWKRTGGRKALDQAA
jgi:hypothetical protein